MTTNTITLVRVFKMGAVRLADPAPGVPAEEAVKLYAVAYPHLANAALGEPQVIGEELHYPVVLPDVKTKG